MGGYSEQQRVPDNWTRRKVVLQLLHSALYFRALFSLSLSYFPQQAGRQFNALTAALSFSPLNLTHWITFSFGPRILGQ